MRFLKPAFLFFLAIIPSIAEASGTLTGVIVTPNSSVPVSNSTMTFSLSQAGIDVSQTYNISTTPISCYTDGGGNVRGVPNPLIQPTLVGVTGGGGSLTGSYFVRYAYYNNTGVSAAGPTVQFIMGAASALNVTVPAIQPASALGYKIYMGTVSGSETLQATSTGWTNTTIFSYSVTTAYPPTNTSVCTFTFNDSIIPVSTTYQVNLLTNAGNRVSGFPQTWYLAGSTVSISSIYPTAGTAQVRYPNPLLSTPLSSYAVQSLNSDLTLNNFKLTSIGSLTLTPTTTPFISSCSEVTEGRVYSITDSDTQVWGTVVSGLGSSHALIYCDSVNWTVIGK